MYIRYNVKSPPSVSAIDATTLGQGLITMSHISNEPKIVSPSNGTVAGGVRQVLRLEGLAMLVVATYAYFASGGNLWLYAALFFAPDLSFFAYAVNARLGAVAYNTVHSYASAALLAGAGWLLGVDLLWHIALILVAHAGFDRAVGYGLKYATAFNHTHLGFVGKSA